MVVTDDSHVLHHLIDFTHLNTNPEVLAKAIMQDDLKHWLLSKQKPNLEGTAIVAHDLAAQLVADFVLLCHKHSRWEARCEDL